PAPVRQQRKLPPQRLVRDQRMPVQIRRKHALAVRARLGVVHPAECRLVPGGPVAFDDEGAHVRRVTVMVSDKSTVLVAAEGERKSTRLNSSHQIISYAVFCLKKKNINQKQNQERHKTAKTGANAVAPLSV